MSRRVDTAEPLPRTALINKTKLIEEGRLEETKIVLGWLLDTRRLKISLPAHKFIAWTGQINEIVKSGKTTANVLEAVLGRMTNASSILSMDRHFLPRLRYFHSKMAKYKSYTLNKTMIADFEIRTKILNKVHEGVSMNTISFCLPDICYFGDACNHGLGDWNHLGEFYGFVTPANLVGHAHINELEFLTCVIYPWLDIINGRILKGDCILVMGDSTTAMGWLHKSRYREKGETAERHAIRLKIARKLAELVIDNNLTLYSQWFPGKNNIIADCLSRNSHLSDPERIALFSSFFNEQDTPRFRRTILPAEILEWICSIFQMMPKSVQTHLEHTNSGLQIGKSGRNSCSKLELEAIDIWRHFPPLEDKQSLEHSPPLSERRSILEAKARQWLPSGTVRLTVANVSQTFVSNGLPDPRLDVNGNICLRSQQIYRGFEKVDPKKKHQKAVPLKVLREVLSMAQKSRDESNLAIAHLIIGAYGFAMRSCEYVKTCFDEENKRTKILRVKNIRFFLRKRLLPHSDIRIF